MDAIRQIEAAPLGISVYSVKRTATRLHNRGMLEIIFCLKGTVKFSYSYEEFTLHEGEFISVDRDAYYLYDGEDNICVSFYIDLAHYEQQYPYIGNTLFVCEGIEGEKIADLSAEYDKLKGLMIIILKYIASGVEACQVEKRANSIVEVFLRSFNIFFYCAGRTSLDENILNRAYTISRYLFDHFKEKVTVRALAAELNLSENYISKYMAKYSIGFRDIITYLRASESERYLLNTDMTIMEISEECGFSDVKYYYSAFRAWYKCTPKQFRQKYKNVSEESIEFIELEDIKEILNDLLVDHYISMFTHEEEKTDHK